mmetsp:Transcript_65541/g.75399  ORF Transcript_65541/g.75399 Transcript_65541/m.75399 type:complete len:245 (+) Transcript_65541:63-797(+)|eukprot:CAMPEP_0115007226 /NCGR_PEP_ID=MMETSP0216-20121206/21035_1 /TAXON_ID=223996 /ORGANISM="Protocruzia adherens, Strain Boccale" /LENGTH=244 /DNA_ID=CAMNT_0002374091 /DNA_START=39 /DNA_END=773 /DNA_ORIENTATION=-
MFRNQYDTDCITWNPQGRIFQVEYAMEAVKQGSCTVGLTSKTHAVLLASKKAISELSSYQDKVFKVDDHIGISISGLSADGRVLCNFMRNESLNHQFVYESAHPVGRLVEKIAEKSQLKTQRYSKRPYGVGLLVTGVDKTGAHLYETSPSGEFNEYKSIAIGAKSQASKTYLEKNFESFTDLSLDDLIKHGVTALRKAESEDNPITSKNLSIGVVGIDEPFRLLEGEEVSKYLPAAEGQMDTSA